MGVIARFVERRYSLADLDRDMEALYLGRNSVTGVTVNERTALQCSAVFACVQLLAETVASLPLPVYRGLPPREKERAYNHHLYPLLHDEPNPEMTSFNFREALQGHLALWGNAYAEIDWDMRSGKIRGLWPLRPDRMRVARREGKLWYHYRLPDGTEAVLPAYRVWHIPGLGFDGIMGYSPIHMAREAIGLALATEEYGARFFGNGATPGGVLQHPGTLGETAQGNLRKSWNEMHQGLANQHRIAILEEGMKYQQVGIPPEDAQFLECVIPDTAISMADGSVCKAAQLKIGDAVLGWDYRNDRLEPSRVLYVGSNGEHPLMRVTTHRGRQLITTLNHPYLASFRTRRRGRTIRSNPAWIPVHQLHVGDYVRVGLDYSFKTEMDFNIGWMVGALIGDGHLRSRGSVGFSKGDQGVINRMCQCASECGVELRHSSGCDYYFGGNGYGGKNKMRAFLQKYGLLDIKAHEKFVPKEIMTGGGAAWCGLLSGLMDTDGTISHTKLKQPKAVWDSTSRQLLDGCQHLLSLLNVQSSIYQIDSIYRERPYTMWQLSVCGREEIEKLAGLLELASEGKRDRLATWAQMPGKRVNTPELVQFDRIINIEMLEADKAISIEIEGTRSHVTNGLVTHNTRKFQRNEIASFFHIPPHMIGDLERATFSNIEQQSIEFVVYTMRPWFVRWEQSIQKNLMGPAERRQYFAEFLVQGLLRGDTISRFQAYATARQWGWMSADDIRELENQNPLPDGQGQIYYMPMNMLPASMATGAADKGREAGTLKELRSSRSALQRYRMAGSYRRVFEDAGKRIVERETNNVLRAARKYLGERTAGDFNAWLDDFYRDFPEYITRQISPAVRGLAEAIEPLASDEVNAAGGMTAELDKFLADYASAFNARYTDSSRGQLRAIMEEAEEAGEEALPLVETRLEEWGQRRPGKVGMNETVQLSSAVAKVVFVGAGVTKLVWRAMGSESCPYCQEMDGRVVGIEQDFVGKGETLKAEEGNEGGMKIYHPTSHPPLHEGCVCGIGPG